MQKQCTKCKEEKSINDFYTQNNKPGAWCKECRKKYRLSRKERDRELRKKYYQNPENRIKKRGWERARRIRLPAEYLFMQARTRSKRLGIEFNIDVTDVIIPKICPLLECDFIPGEKDNYKYSYSLDRIDPSKGYIKGNVRVISSLANTMKNSATKEQLLLFSKNIVGYIGNDIVRTNEN